MKEKEMFMEKEKDITIEDLHHYKTYGFNLSGTSIAAGVLSYYDEKRLMKLQYASDVREIIDDMLLDMKSEGCQFNFTEKEIGIPT